VAKTSGGRQDGLRQVSAACMAMALVTNIDLPPQATIVRVPPPMVRNGAHSQLRRGGAHEEEEEEEVDSRGWGVNWPLCAIDGKAREGQELQVLRCGCCPGDCISSPNLG
jgi:hypothetical protein